jgi:hypothetical protein
MTAILSVVTDGEAVVGKPLDHQPAAKNVAAKKPYPSTLFILFLPLPKHKQKSPASQ